jgi:hypothetical protein
MSMLGFAQTKTRFSSSFSWNWKKSQENHASSISFSKAVEMKEP